MTHSDGATLVMDYFPPNFEKMPKKTPIILFLYGMVGAKNSLYV